ncbi:MAG: glucokinase [Gammaproteobacteria bacterium]|nr:glucokinase [Gammaproteobacteria bacterium]
MAYILAVDIGGTKTLFQLSSDNNDIVLELSFASAGYASFDDALSAFLSHEKIKLISIARACFAVAGPVLGRDAYVTNLPWQLNADDLAEKFNIGHVQLCNDFEAVGYGIDYLTEEDIVSLQQGQAVQGTPRAVIGAGTGLGQALLIPVNGDWRVLPTEGGHVDFAPTSKVQILLLEHMMERFGQVSYERLVSGIGLVSIYEFLRAYRQHDEDPALRQAMIEHDASAAISAYALNHTDSLASEALELFITIYGSQAGNLALSVLPRAGLYIAGGIAAKNLQRFQTGAFINAFNAKGKMAELAQTIPVRLIVQPKVGLIGARHLAQQSAV